MKPHLFVHCIVLGLLSVLGVTAVMSGKVHISRTWILDIIPFVAALFAACFGIWKTARYSKNIDRGCEITVTTAEAKVFPYLFYVVSIVLATIRLIA
jgi:hypothetical protein